MAHAPATPVARPGAPVGAFSIDACCRLTLLFRSRQTDSAPNSGSADPGDREKT